MCQGGKRVAGKLHSFYIVMKACGSPNQNGRVVNGVCVLYGSRLSTSQVRYILNFNHWVFSLAVKTLPKRWVFLGKSMYIS